MLETGKKANRETEVDYDAIGKNASDPKKRSYMQTFIRYYQVRDGKLLSYFNGRKRHGTALERPARFAGKRHG